ncbi:3-ketoacyl-ACP reductase [Aurantibacter crassamenti]|uniref:3-ketoacyl-ACP reductase n=1 Tax=Aurantibacter crassamenti TaxID=1837375 RepID=UPI0019397353|nr:3-ketoacyl-ACP reductase [Aurantibacter crassamenti]MBM1105714.1 3-ketoacyl-ACP reductase [Aurantibacter crassamenti]
MIKNVLITGGSRGIGLGIAHSLAEDGCNIAINGVRDESQVQAVLNELKKYGTKVIYCQGNVAVAKDRDSIVAKTISEFKNINVLVNNAGVGPKERVDLLKTSEDSYDRVMGVNLKGAFFLTQKVANHMVSCKIDNPNFEGQIINMSSVSATMVSIERGEYCISKSGMSMMTQLFATRLGEYDIPVYELRPGVIETDMTAGVQEKYQKLVTEGLTVEPRMGLPKDVALAVTALVKGQIPYATGQVLNIDGGLSIPRF